MKTVTEILSDLEKYENWGEFEFCINDDLVTKCDIPKKNEYSGLYVFLAPDDKLIYVGISGRASSDRNIIHRKDGLRGRFLTGKQFGARRSKSLSMQMKLDGFSKLKIRWFVTWDDNSTDLPRPIEKQIIEAFKMQNDNQRPKWNKRD